mmetsp:Transcript_28408/g.28713  ORF Transcript_28408/g.28713 Transcript_28408/m.28713 type:complete len:522 (+) Transcript_28408:177-1742(+)|eukprot:CAMPEP_0182417818 /NCGR_PEP_ID=MMETSP1167-20130531/2257_1 /TAXON_ID=2988 /ORGANISM="Mallomonas Sp, Strain CCMP3275" /LENGTH=521 /DNA_ID=CAMNT_0024591613 /DNA_START=175 /DNA_END=1740 /DNA_ORIENTATION=+
MSNSQIGRVILIRHGESIWNCTDVKRHLKLRFTGWADVRLTELGIRQAKASGRCLKRFSIQPNVAYTSLLQRSRKTLNLAMESGDIKAKDVPVVNSWRLNERHYGALVGLSKEEAIEIMGKELVFSWRRSWHECPPGVDINDDKDWRNLITVEPKTIVSAFGNVSVNVEKDVYMPDTESLEDCAKRSVLLWNSSIAPRILLGQTVLLVAHANTIRGLVKMIDGEFMSLQDIQDVMIPSAVPLVYEFTKNLVPVMEPTMLGMRGRYLLTKELIHLSHVMTRKDGSPTDKTRVYLSPASPSVPKFEDIIDMSLVKAKAFSGSGLGRHVPIAITNYRGRYVYANHAWYELTGYRTSDAMNKSWKFMHGPKTTRQSICDLNARVHSGLAVNANIVYYHKDGTAHEWNTSVIPLYDWLYDQDSIEAVREAEEDLDEDHPDHELYHAIKHMIPSHYVSVVNTVTPRPDISPVNQVFTPVDATAGAKDIYSMYRKPDIEEVEDHSVLLYDENTDLVRWTQRFEENDYV